MADWLDEFSSLSGCEIPLAVDLSLKGVGVGLGLLVLIGELTTLLVRMNSIRVKGKATVSLIIWTLIQNLIMILRPWIGLRSETTLWMAFITHISGAIAAGVVILFIYIELGIIQRSSMKKEAGCLLRNKGVILIGTGIVQALCFLAGPLGSPLSDVLGSSRSLLLLPFRPDLHQDQ